MYANLLGAGVYEKEGNYTTNSSFPTIFCSFYIVHFLYPEK